MKMELGAILTELELRTTFHQERMNQAALQNDLSKVHIALGGKLACEELLRHFRAKAEGAERKQEMKKAQYRARRLRDHQRQLHKIA